MDTVSPEPAATVFMDPGLRRDDGPRGDITWRYGIDANLFQGPVSSIASVINLDPETSSG
jgi:hypothetical protein